MAVSRLVAKRRGLLRPTLRLSTFFRALLLSSLSTGRMYPVSRTLLSSTSDFLVVLKLTP